LFSLSGVAPLGAFLVVHAIANVQAVRGDAAFLATTRAFERLPALPLLELLLVFAPLVVHGAIGSWLVVTRTPLDPPAPYPSRVRTAMRVTGVVALAFLALHLLELRFAGAAAPGARPRGGEILSTLESGLASTWHGLPWRGVAYLVAAGCVAFHFAAGLWGISVAWRAGRDAGGTSGAGAPPNNGRGGPGDPAGQRARARAAWVAGALGAVLWALFAEAVVFHATGARLVGSPPDGADEDPRPGAGPCPEPTGVPK
jgi:succinate dehydrogenase / fumarate reductase cytochrome b subunit